METRKSQHQASSFLLSVTILNFDVQTPVLFLHITIDPKKKTITGTCDISIPKFQSLKPFKTEISGGYKSLEKGEGTQHYVNLAGFLSFDQTSPDVKINMIVNREWKKGTVCYEYLKNGKWVAVSDVYLKIKSSAPLSVPKSILDINPGKYSTFNIR